MDLIEYEQHTRSEKAARKYMLRHCWNGKQRFCPKCGQKRIYRLSDERMRCSECRYTFHDFSRRWINMGGLSCLDWLRLTKLFELDLTANRMAPQLRLSYNTVYKAITTLRLSILAQALDAQQILGPGSGLDLGFDGRKVVLEGGRDPLNRYPVFGIIEKNGWAFIDLLPDVDAETVLHFNLNFSLKLTRMGNIVYTDRYKNYDALIFCGDDGLPMNYMQIRGRNAYVDSLKGNFWSFARKRLKQFNGVSSRRFPLYLKELEFRYNYRNDDVFPLFVQSLCSIVPDYK